MIACVGRDYLIGSRYTDVDNEIFELINQGLLKWNGTLYFLSEIKDIIKLYKYDSIVLKNGNQLIRIKYPVNMFGYDSDNIQLEIEGDTILYIHVRFQQKKEFDKFVLSLFNSDKAKLAFCEDKVGPVAIFKYKHIMIQVGPEKYSVKYFFQI